MASRRERTAQINPLLVFCRNRIWTSRWVTDMSERGSDSVCWSIGRLKLSWYRRSNEQTASQMHQTFSGNSANGLRAAWSNCEKAGGVIVDRRQRSTIWSFYFTKKWALSFIELFSENIGSWESSIVEPQRTTGNKDSGEIFFLATFPGIRVTARVKSWDVRLGIISQLIDYKTLVKLCPSNEFIWFS